MDSDSPGPRARGSGRARAGVGRTCRLTRRRRSGLTRRRRIRRGGWSLAPAAPGCARASWGGRGGRAHAVAGGRSPRRFPDAAAMPRLPTELNSGNGQTVKRSGCGLRILASGGACAAFCAGGLRPGHAQSTDAGGRPCRDPPWRPRTTRIEGLGGRLVAPRHVAHPAAMPSCAHYARQANDG